MKQRNSIAAFVVGLFLLMSVSCAAEAATYYVATNGNDGNAGTESAPFRTIARGSRALAAGDTLLIRAGTYEESMWDGQFGFGFTNGTASAYTRYAAYNGETAVIKPPSRSLGNYVIWLSTATRYVEIRGLILDGTNATSAAVRFDTNSTGAHAQNNRLIGNEIMNGRQGIYGGGGNEIIGNRIHHMSGYGMYTADDSGLIEGNVIHDNGGYGIHHFQQNKTVNNWIIRNNIFYRNGLGFYHSSSPTILRHPPAVLISRGRNNRLYNNLVYNNVGGGIRVGLGAVDSIIANNSVYGNNEYGIDVNAAFSGSRNARVINNISWGNKDAQISDNATGTVLQNNLTTDPKFVNAAGGDFHLQAGSPAIDAGQTLAEVVDDIDGGARPAGAAYDIGAYESGALPRICSVPGTAVAVPTSVIDPSTGQPPTRPGYVLVGAVPAGFTLSAGTVEKTVPEGTVYRLSLAQLSGLTLTPPADFKGTVKIEAFFVPQ